MVFVNRVQPDSEFVIVKARMWIIEHRDMVENSIQAVARNLNRRWTELLQTRHRSHTSRGGPA
jgi:hypothetical protein